MLRALFLFGIFCLCSCTLDREQVPETVISYAVSSTSNQAESFTVSYLDPDGQTITQGEFTSKAWSSPSWEDEFKRGDLVEIKVTSKNPGTPIQATIYFNYYILESARMQHNDTELLIQLLIPL